MKKLIKVTQPKYSMGYMAMLMQRLMQEEFVFSSHYIGQSYVVYVWTPESLSVIRENDMLSYVKTMAVNVMIDRDSVRMVREDQRHQTELTYPR